ncbi:MAG: type II toxin-antitoxin system Phd/YefM family antitoxin [Parcubacteria group bacterium]|nr:type II toxin-antitoxin system Phd/YefM family antitoxin [Parcubacteria group bacterium]
MVNIVPITQARINLGSIVKRVRLDKEYFVLEKDGYPVAGLIDIDEFEDFLESRNSTIKKQITKSYKEYKAGKIRPAGFLIKKLKKK